MPASDTDALQFVARILRRVRVAFGLQLTQPIEQRGFAPIRPSGNRYVGQRAEPVVLSYPQTCR